MSHESADSDRDNFFKDEYWNAVAERALAEQAKGAHYRDAPNTDNNNYSVPGSFPMPDFMMAPDDPRRQVPGNTQDAVDPDKANMHTQPE